MPLKIAALLLAGLCASALNAQTLNRSDFEQILVPIGDTDPIPGAGGSLWKTELWVRNSSNTALIFGQGEPTCTVGCGGREYSVLDGHMTGRFSGATDGVQPGILLYVEKTRRHDLALALHAQDVSRNSMDWGTQLPIVRENGLFTSAFEIINVPNESNYRVSFRVYGLASSSISGRVRVIVSPINSDETLLERELQLQGVMHGGGGFYSHPTYADIHALTSGVGPEHPRLRIRVEPLQAGTYWAFASITNNVTQHVTVVSPQ